MFLLADSTAALTPAVFGLVGVVVGGLLNGLVGAVADSRRDRREATVAARLVRHEIEFLSAEVASWVREGEVPESAVPLKREAWDAHHEILARVLLARDWDMLAATYTWVELMNNDPERSVGPISRDFCESVHTEMRGGVVVLARLAAGKRPRGTLRDRFLNRRFVRSEIRRANAEEGTERLLDSDRVAA
jgi:hypothetical protein